MTVLVGGAALLGFVGFWVGIILWVSTALGRDATRLPVVDVSHVRSLDRTVPVGDPFDWARDCDDDWDAEAVT